MRDAGTVLKHQVAFYLNTGNETTPIWSRIGKGFTSLTGALNAQTETSQYIDESVASNETTSYQPNYTTTAERYNGDPANDFLYEGGLNQVIGKTAQMCRVDLTDNTTGTTYSAKMGNYNLNYNDFDTGAAGEKVGYGVEFSQVGSLANGTFDIEAKTFVKA